MLPLAPLLLLPLGQNKIQQKFSCHEKFLFTSGSINLPRRDHQIIQIIEKDGLSLTPPLLITEVKKNFIKSFLVMSGNFIVPGYTNVSQRVLEIIPKN